jgi:hypothetical protein
MGKCENLLLISYYFNILQNIIQYNHNNTYSIVRIILDIVILGKYFNVLQNIRQYNPIQYNHNNIFHCSNNLGYRHIGKYVY